MSQIVAAAVLVLAQLGSPTPQGAAADSTLLEDMARRALARVERMRNQKLSKPLRMGVKSRGEVTKFIQERLAEEYGPQKVAAEGRFLKLQGLLPTELDYGAFVTSLLAEQVAGFYDHTRQTLHIAAWIPIFIQEPVMAHEIFHAIQDQEWGGGKLIDSKKYTHDRLLAHAALLEGDATVVMLNYPQAQFDVNTDMSTSAFAINMVATSLPLQMASPQFPIMSAAPDYLKQSLIFPYQQGLLFISALRQSGLAWSEIRKVYADPPTSTEQILHPERYFKQRDDPSEVKLPPFVREGFRRTWEGTTGEFHARQLLLSALPLAQAVDGASGWDGDHTALEVNGQKAVVVTLATWDTPGDALTWETAVRVAYDKRPAPKPPLAIVRAGMNTAYAWSADAALAREAAVWALEKGTITRK